MGGDGGVLRQGIIRVGQKVIARLMESQIWCPPVPARGRISQGTMASV